MRRPSQEESLEEWEVTKDYPKKDHKFRVGGDVEGNWRDGTLQVEGSL